MKKLILWAAALVFLSACKQEPPVVSVTAVTVKPATLTLTEGDSQRLQATVSPADATDKTITWSSSNTQVVTVTDGTVKAIKPGSATISASAGGKKGTCQITVQAKIVNVSGIALDVTEKQLEEGESFTLKATITPDNASDKTVTWSSQNADIAEVDQNGKVTAKKAGQTTVTATTKDGAKTASCAITVIARVASIALDVTEKQLEEGESFTLTATITPDNASDKTVTWTSQNADIAEVDQNGKVTAKKAGQTTVTATTKDGAKTASCAITVIARVASIALDVTEKQLEEGESFTLTATITPDNASDKTVTWTSQNADIAEVDQNGKVTAKKAGQTTVTATTKDGAKTASCAITVIARVASIALDVTEKQLEEGESFTLTATITPNNASDKTVTWTSQNAEIAEVDQNGKVTAKKAGQTTVTVTTNDGAKTASCVITVIARVASVAVTPVELTLYIGQSSNLTATITPDNASDKTVVWSSQNAEIAEVDQNGKVTAKKTGQTTITVTTNDGAKTASCAVTVRADGGTEDFGDGGGYGEGDF